MPQVVQGPDGNSITFPDGTDDATIQNVMSQAYKNQAIAAQAGSSVAGAQPGSSSATPQQTPTPDFGLSLAKSSDQVLDNAAILASKIPVAGPFIDNLAGPQHTAQSLADEHKAYFDAQAAQGHGSDMPIGNFSGSVLASLPFAGITRNPIAAGAIAGGLGTKDPNDPLGTVIDAGAGGVAGKLGDIGTRLVGNAINPIIRPFVQRMIDAGVPLTPGQILGGGASMIENGMKYIPVLGDLVGNAQDKALSGFNTAAYNEALQYIGAKVPDGMTGGEASAFTQKAISDQYQKILPTLRVQGDAQFRTDMADLRNTVNGGELPPDKVTQFNNLMGSIGARFSRAGGMTGRTMGDVDSILGQKYADYRGSPNPDDQAMARAILQAQANLRDLVYRSNPQAGEALAKTREAFKTFVPAELAAGKGSTDELGRFQPGAYKGAVAEADTTIRNRATQQGTAAGAYLANAAIGTLGRNVTKPTSLNPLLRGGAGLGVLLAHSHINPAAAAVAAPYTDIGGAAARWALTGRQGPVATAVGGAVRSAAPFVASAAGAAAPKRQSAVTIEDVHPATADEIQAATAGGQ